MSETKKDLIANLAVGALISAAVFYLNHSRGYVFLRCLCDGFFVASVILLGIGSIKAVRNKGAFDVAGFGMKSTIDVFMPYLRRENRQEDIMAYRERKELERKSAKGLLLAGGVYLLLSLVSLGVYYLLR